MNVLIKKPLCTSVPLKLLVAVIVCAFLGENAKADNWFDVNGTATGYGTVGGGSYSWDDPNWATVVGGTSATGNWVQGSFARFLGTGSYTVTISGSETNAGMVQAPASGTGNALTINAAGSGNLYIAPNGSLTTGLPVQGYFCTSAGILTINAPITGPGGINFGLFSGTGAIHLSGNNTYSGGNTLTTSSYLIFFNNNNSFGTGPINVNGTTFANLLSEGGAPITLANNWTNTANSGVNFGSGANTPVTLTGPWALQTFNLNLRNNGDSTASLTLAGPVSGSGNITLSGNNSGTIVFSGANTYSGQTIISAGNSGVTLSAGSLNSVSSGAPSSNLGHPTTVANGTISIGSAALTSTLIYTGPGETSDRVINLAGTSGGATLEADGTGALVLTAVNTATGAGAKTLTLQGSSTAANSIGKIVDSSGGATAVVKAQAGTWKLTGANTYTGGTTVNAGTLEISGSVTGTVTNNSVLTLDLASALASSTTLAASSGTTINLNFTGTNAINGLIIDGVSQVSGVWGPPGSGAPNQNAIFAGTGKINILGKPVIVQQPVSGSVFLGDVTSFTFNVGVVGDLSTVTYQWKQNGVNIPGATSSSYLIPSPVAASSAGSYSVAVTNAFGFALSASANLFVMKTNDYTQIIRAGAPIAYWRLDETNGSLAYDTVGQHNGFYVNANLNQPGFSAATGSDPAIAVPAISGQKGYMVYSNAAPDFSFTVATPFTLEAWANSTNFSAKQRVISSLSLAGGGYGFGFLDNQNIQFTAGGVDEFTSKAPTPLAAGVWYHLVISFDGNTFTTYLNGNPIGTTNTGLGFTLNASPGQITFGNNQLTYPTEQLYGGVDEVAIYNYWLDPLTITNHYLARYSDQPAPTVSTPVVTPPTNYVSLSTTLTESAGGAGLTYQWYKGAGTGSPVAGGTDSTLTIGPLHLSDAANYHCVVTDFANHSADSPLAFLAVIPIPTSASDLNLTNGLVLHLPFDTDYKDISGEANNGTAVGSPSAVSGEIGSSALHYGTTNGVATNYVTVGVVPDLQFGASVDFSVSYWVRGTINTNLPFFCDSKNGLAGIIAQTGGYYFGPDTAGDGGWAAGLGSTGHEMSTSGAQTINDGNWHNLIHVANRLGNMTTYLDGNQVDNHAISFITDSVNTTNAANIGQDGTGAFAVTQDQAGDLDDLGVWRRTLTPLEVSGIYLAGVSNHVSFAPPVNPVVRAALQIVQVSPGVYQIVWPGGGTLQASGDVLGTYTNVPSGTSPYTVPVSSGPQLFYRLKY
jgi:autotransporter-associated beta strand protein